ncbi:lysozyme inhibitor [Arenibacter sp. 6A1]|uniref:MliC family protein n=1 Tax=Arenibacter sp. 6A1 TaxID=2720391 RepID=UPI001445DBA4|nr:MliC family protein [Arenibacter sp. 6A1]NKI25514.1 lysozyme inhibitor [Arenibacter sp. 6A1]
MAKNILTMAVLTALFLNSCKESPKQENAATTTTETVEKVTDEIVNISSTDKDGKKIKISYNNTKETATLNFNGETIELVSQKPASGIWYKNDRYELSGKGNDIELKKEGKVVFTHEDDIVKTSLRNKEGQTLDMTFNNTTNQVKVYVNGGEQIELVGQISASGIWYKNDRYELRGKGENLELTEDGKTIFKN